MLESASRGGVVCLVPGEGLPGPGGFSLVGGVCLVLGGLPGLGGGLSGRGGLCLVPGGSAWSGGGRGGLPSLGGCLPGGVGLASQHALRQTPSPPVDRQTPVKTLPWPQLRCGR